jgi:YhcH/YjgK/YiaL family protein
MVMDSLRNANLYYGLGPRLEAALRALAGKLPNNPVGRYELLGSEVYADVQVYVTQPQAQCRWEAHRKFIDVQYVSEGVERVAVAPLEAMTESVPYDAARDVAFYTGDGPTLPLKAGGFMIFFPQDAHMPRIADGTSGTVRKVVVKVAV